MGKTFSTIGSYWIILPDYEYAYHRASSKDREYFTKKKLEVTFNCDGKEEQLKLPYTKIFKIKKDKQTGRYHKDWTSFDLRKTLWMEIVRRGIDVYLTPYICNSSYVDASEFYLESPLLDNRVQLSNEKPDPVLIEGYEIFQWFDKHGLSYK